MKRSLWFFALLGMFALLAPVAGLRADASLDQLTLKDGRVIQGQIVSESDSGVDILVSGTKQSFARSNIASVAYAGADGTAAGAGTPDAGSVAAPATTVPSGGAPMDSEDAQLAARYQVPEKDVQWVRAQGIPGDEVENVFAVAADAQVTLRAVVDLRLKGWSWGAIREHYGLAESPAAYAEPGPPPPPRPRVIVEEPPVVPCWFFAFWAMLFLSHGR